MFQNTEKVETKWEIIGKPWQTSKIQRFVKIIKDL